MRHRKRLGHFKSVVVALFVAAGSNACSSDELAQPAKAWHCSVVSTGLSEICVCADNGDPANKTEPCPSSDRCCTLNKQPNQDGVRQCVCLEGDCSNTTVDSSAEVVPSCPPP